MCVGPHHNCDVALRASFGNRASVFRETDEEAHSLTRLSSVTTKSSSRIKMEIVCRPIIPQQTTDEREINGFAGMRSRFRRRVSLTRDVETETVSVSCLSDLDISIDVRCRLRYASSAIMQ